MRSLFDISERLMRSRCRRFALVAGGERSLSSPVRICERSWLDIFTHAFDPDSLGQNIQTLANRPERRHHRSMSKPNAISLRRNPLNGEGEVHYLREYDLMDDVVRLDFLKDVIFDLTREYHRQHKLTFRVTKPAKHVRK